MTQLWQQILPISGKGEDIMKYRKWMTVGAKIAEWMEEHNIKEGSRITVIQNCMGDLIIGTRKGKMAVGKEIAFRIKV